MRVLVTGAGRGIGAACALAIARSWPGVRIAIGEKELTENLEVSAAALRAAGAAPLCLVGDLADPQTPARLIEQAVKEFGGLDAVVSNAGLTGPGPLADLELQEFDKLMNVNLRAAWLLAKAAYFPLKLSKGSLTGIASTAGVLPYAGMGAYSTSKAGLIMLLRQLAQEWAPDGIRVNSVSPGMVRTPLSEVVYQDETLKAAREALIPAGRIATPQDIARVVVFLVGESANYMTGQNVVVDGGYADSVNKHIPGFSVAPD